MTWLEPVIAAALRGESVPWSTLPEGGDERTLLEECEHHGVLPLLHCAIARMPGGCDWPEALRDELASRARRTAAEELLARRELMAVLEALAARGVRPLLMKGTPLAYSVYPSPSLRPRCDTDLLILEAESDTVRDTLAGQGFERQCSSAGELLFCQFTELKRDGFGVDHALDFHWEISCRKLFSGLLGYDEALDAAVPVAALGPHARALGPVHALMLACVHPVMHHHGDERLIWHYDVHLLLEAMSADELDELVGACREKGVREICRHAIGRAAQTLGTQVSEACWRGLAPEPGEREATAEFLDPARRWHHDQLSDLRALPDWGSRARLLREIAFPSPEYMLKSYRLGSGLPERALLPALYLHRALRGLGKVALKRK